MNLLAAVWILGLSILFPLICIAQKNDRPYQCYEVHNSKREIRQFLFKYFGFAKTDFENGDVIADIGAGNGYVDEMISLL